MLNWSNHNSRNFYHFFLEALPSLIVGLRATQAVSNMHVFASQEQVSHHSQRDSHMHVFASQEQVSHHFTT